MSHGKPAKKSTLTLKQIDTFLDELTQVTREAEQVQLFQTLIPKCTGGAYWLCMHCPKIGSIRPSVPFAKLVQFGYVH